MYSVSKATQREKWWEWGRTAWFWYYGLWGAERKKTQKKAEKI